MNDILARICAYKREEVAAARRDRPLAALEREATAAAPPRGFARTVRRTVASGRTALIAEIKKASPSKGLIRKDFDPAALACAYEAGGAACLSVLTDAPSFQGSADALREARTAAKLPLLRKDFMLDPYQAVEARAWGADCILIVLACADDAEARALADAATDLGMDLLIEAHDEREIERGLALAEADPERRLLGVNNRDLRDFRVDLATTERLARLVPGDITLVGESGIAAPADVARLRRAGVGAILVGESLMREADVEAATRALLARETLPA